MIETVARPFSDGEEVGEMFVEEHGSRLLYGDPRERSIETRRQAGDQSRRDEERQ